MKLKKYLTEARKKNIPTLTDEQKEFLEKKASKILKIYRSTGKYLYRGIRGGEKGIFVEKKGHIASRKSKDTDPKIHKALNDKFKEKFGWKVRNGVSTTNSYGQAVSYGDVYVFFPPNNFKYVWSEKIKDLFTELPIARTGIPVGIAGSRKEENEFLKKKQRTFSRVVNKYTDKDLEKVLNDPQYREILFKVGKYWLVDHRAVAEWFEEIE